MTPQSLLKRVYLGGTGGEGLIITNNREEAKIFGDVIFEPYYDPGSA